jgi:hypothetical protein
MSRLLNDAKRTEMCRCLLAAVQRILNREDEEAFGEIRAAAALGGGRLNSLINSTWKKSLGESVKSRPNHGQPGHRPANKGELPV